MNTSSIDFSTHPLDDRLRLLVDRLGFFPSESFLQREEHLHELLQAAEQNGGLQHAFDRLGGKALFQNTTVSIPSLRQKIAAATIAHDGFHHRRKKIEMSIPGSRKTGGVLIAADVINREYMTRLLEENGGVGAQRVKTLYASPSGIVGKMMAEARRFLPDYRLVCVTQKTREEDLRRAADPETDMIFLGYSLSFRKERIHVADLKGDDTMVSRFLDLMGAFPSIASARARLEEIVGADRTAQFMDRKPDWPKLLERIILEEEKQTTLSVVDVLRKKVFTPEQASYIILGEAHNLVAEDSETASAISGLFKDARWGVLETGTAVRNNIHHMSFLMELLGFVEEARQFKSVVRNDPLRVRAALKPYVITPVITHVRQIDPLVPDPEDDPVARIVRYRPEPAVLDAHIALMNSDLFSGAERLYLDRLLLAHPRALQPQNFPIESGKALYRKIHDFFDEHAELLERLKTVDSARVKKTKDLVREHIAEGKKTLIFCEHDITDFLAQELAVFGCRRIDQSVPLDLEDDGYTTREIALHEAAANPDVKVVVATRGTLREGLDAPEFTRIIEYEETTVPFKRGQTIARAHRSGQREVVKVRTLHAEGIETDELIAEFRAWKEHLGTQVYEGRDPSHEELDAYLRDVGAASSPQLSSLLGINSRGRISLIFNSLIGCGSERFAEQMRASQNANLLSRHFNYQWRFTYSANCARLMAEKIIPEIETQSGSLLEGILDGACGPDTIARTLRRPTTNIDILRLQLEYGEDACERIGVRGNEHLLGSIHNLKRVIPLSATDEDIFTSSKRYEGEREIRDAGFDLYVCSLGVYYLNIPERLAFFREARRVLRKGKHLMLLMPRSKIDPQCEGQFLQDMEAAGFQIDQELTGEYSARHAQNIETGEARDGATFDPYIIVARSEGEENTAYFAQKRDFFILEPGFAVKDTPTRAQNLERAREESRKPRVLYQDFYRKRPAQVITSTATETPTETSPIDGTTATRDGPTVGSQLDELSRLPEDDQKSVRTMLDALSDALKPKEETKREGSE